MPVTHALKNVRTVGVIRPPGAYVDNDEFIGSYNDDTPVSVDTVYGGAKYNSARVAVYIGDTDIAVATITLYESDDDTTYAEITGADGHHRPTAADEDGNDLFGSGTSICASRKRYLQVHAQGRQRLERHGRRRVRGPSCRTPPRSPLTDTDRGARGDWSTIT
jgi:hypothetical protein